MRFEYGGKQSDKFSEYKSTDGQIVVLVSQLMDKLWVDCWYDTIEMECGEIQGNVNLWIHNLYMEAKVVPSF